MSTPEMPDPQRPGTANLVTSKVDRAGRTPSRTDSSHARRVSLLVYHRDGACIVPLQPNVAVVVGRDPSADVAIDEGSLSRLHARFTLTRTGVIVEDLGSTNGTQVAGNAIEQGALEPGDEVTLGDVVATVHEFIGADARGVVSYERFRARLEDEIVRARFFKRPLSLVMIASARGQRCNLYDCLRAVERSLRPVDVLGLYSEDIIQLLLPEANAAQAVQLARAATIRNGTEPSLVAGIAAFPDAGSTADELLGACRCAVRQSAPPERVRTADGTATRVCSVEGVAASTLTASTSDAMQRVIELARRSAKATVPVLIHGETGAGKEVLARFIHSESPRAQKPMICVNCAAIPCQLVETTLFGHERGAFTGAHAQQRGAFESADGGTVFLDEIGDLSLAAQGALLRILETKRLVRVGTTKEIALDVRVIAATHRDLEAMVGEGQFRQDLFYRLNALVLELPALRERRTDVVPLALAFLEQASEACAVGLRRFDPEALALLEAHSWPGNVRELKNAIERAVVVAQGETIVIDDLPEKVRAYVAPMALAPVFSLDPSVRVHGLEGEFRARMERLEAKVLLDALAQADWNQTRTARELGMPLRTLVYKLKMHGIRKRSQPGLG